MTLTANVAQGNAPEETSNARPDAVARERPEDAAGGDGEEDARGVPVVGLAQRLGGQIGVDRTLRPPPAIGRGSTVGRHCAPRS